MTLRKKKKEERKGKKYTAESGMRETHFSPVAGDFFSQKADCSFPLIRDQKGEQYHSPALSRPLRQPGEGNRQSHTWNLKSESLSLVSMWPLQSFTITLGKTQFFRVLASSCTVEGEQTDELSDDSLRHTVSDRDGSLESLRN